MPKGGVWSIWWTSSSKANAVIRRTRDTQKHLGDYALFIVGMFPESLQRRRPISPDYYVAQGKQAYTTVSTMDSLRPTAALFRKLAF